MNSFYDELFDDLPSDVTHIITRLPYYSDPDNPHDYEMQPHVVDREGSTYLIQQDERFPSINIIYNSGNIYAVEPAEDGKACNLNQLQLAEA